MQKVKFTKDDGTYKKGKTYEVTDRHAEQLEKSGLIEKEEKASKTTKEDKSDKKTK